MYTIEFMFECRVFNESELGNGAEKDTERGIKEFCIRQLEELKE